MVEVHPNPAAVLKENQEVLDRGGSRTLSFGRLELQIPTSHRAALSLKYPELDSPDWETSLRAWKKFASSAEAKPYKVSRPRYI